MQIIVLCLCKVTARQGVRGNGNSGIHATIRKT